MSEQTTEQARVSSCRKTIKAIRRLLLKNDIERIIQFGDERQILTKEARRLLLQAIDALENP